METTHARPKSTKISYYVINAVCLFCADFAKDTLEHLHRVSPDNTTDKILAEKTQDSR
jgi:hypothetical protein